VVGTAGKLLCASTAAGPAFEGARISMGMRASTGAIWRVDARDGQFVCETLGGAEPRGICGSGLVDAMAAALDLRLVKPGGRLTDPAGLKVSGPVVIDQSDIRQLQLAKAAIAAGVRMLLKEYGAEIEDVKRVYLAGAFGNYVRQSSAARIGLMAFQADNVEPSGNTALLGAKIALGSPDANALCDTVRAQVRHIGLSADPGFQDAYVDEMAFP